MSSLSSMALNTSIITSKIRSKKNDSYLSAVFNRA